MHQLHEINEEAFSEWKEWRHLEKKVKIGPVAEKKQRKFLAQYPPPIQQQIIDHSIQNSYQGLFPPKGNIQPVNTSTRTLSTAEMITDRSWAK